MKKLLLFLFCLPAFAQVPGAPTSPTVGGVPSTATVCPYSLSAAASGLNDGCSGALSTGTQITNFFTGYTGFTYSNRPFWNVAGVDYPVGAPTSGQTYSDPASGGLPTGCSYSAPSVTCNGNNIIFQGWDMTLHGGLKLSISGANNTVTKNIFSAGTNCVDPQISLSPSSGSTVTFTYNTVDGNGIVCRGPYVFDTQIQAGSGNGKTYIFQYNYFFHAHQDNIDMGGGTANIKYNMFIDNGIPGNHSDDFQSCGGTFSSISIQFNTVSQNYTAGFTTQPLHIEAQCTGTVNNSVMSQNVVVSVSGTGTPCTGANFPVGCAANQLLACKDDSGSNFMNNFSAYQNYVDMNGALSYTSDTCTGNPNSTGITWGTPILNFDMRTLKTFTK